MPQESPKEKAVKDGSSIEMILSSKDEKIKKLDMRVHELSISQNTIL